MIIRVDVKGIDKFENALRRIDDFSMDEILSNNLNQMLHRARNGGTPVDTGALRDSAEVTEPRGGYSGEMGYKEYYAGYVEFGHRTVNGGYVPGQYYLSKNLNEQMIQYEKDLKSAVRGLCK